MIKWSDNIKDTMGNSTSNTLVKDLDPEKDTYDKRYERKSDSSAIYCPSCGTTNESDSGFCQKCGVRLNDSVENAHPTVNYTPMPQVTNVYQQPVSYMGNQNVTTLGGWIGWLLLDYFLPIIGAIIMLVSSTDESVKNYAKAKIFFVVAAVIILMVLVFMLGGIGFLSGY